MTPHFQRFGYATPPITAVSPFSASDIECHALSFDFYNNGDRIVMRRLLPRVRACYFSQRDGNRKCLRRWTNRSSRTLKFVFWRCSHTSRGCLPTFRRISWQEFCREQSQVTLESFSRIFIIFHTKHFRFYLITCKCIQVIHSTGWHRWLFRRRGVVSIFLDDRGELYWIWESSTTAGVLREATCVSISAFRQNCRNDAPFGCNSKLPVTDKVPQICCIDYDCMSGRIRPSVCHNIRGR
jgi:hypothetical protein